MSRLSRFIDVTRIHHVTRFMGNRIEDRRSLFYAPGLERRSRLTRYTRHSHRGMLVKVSRRLRVRTGICNIPCRTCHPCWRQSGFIDLTQPLTTSSRAERAACAPLHSLPRTAYKSLPSLPSFSVFLLLC